ncbi:MAG: NAD(P)/FAD-dependent oxidoreductase [Chloroflexi bacterium]|nr:NAD(P)/FAD-dependent oxidoreductase [Chloroflexota bacterium]MBU1750732.1 NAD(P)/FAD-dependent oxidoreductase [Chloroflexota bacterium]
MHIVIIGSGLAGLTAGATLARAGHAVTIFEQFHRAGGVTAPYERHGFKWDMGQLLVEGMGPDEPLGRILAELGLADQVRVRTEDRGYVFPDFAIKKPAEYQGVRWRIDQLRDLFAADAAGLDRYWADYLRFTSVMTLARRMEQDRGLKALYWKLRLYLKLLPLLSKKDWNAQQLMDHYFQSDRLKMVFTSILADFFTAPTEFPGLGVFTLNPEASFDKRMPRELAPDTVQLYYYDVLGGISTLVDALVQQIGSHGGLVHTSRPVARIVVEGGRAIGVVDAAGEQTPADVVIASGGAKETFLKLVRPEHLPADFVERVRHIPLMDSVFMVHLGVDFDPSPYVHGVCTYYYGTYDIDRAITEGRDGVYHEGRDGFVVHVPSLHSPELAPPGHHAMTIYTICPDTLREGDWAELKEEYADRLIAYAAQHIPPLPDHIQVREIVTPPDWRAWTRLDHHAFGGIAPVLGAWRVPHQTPVAGLWFVGAQSESGGGVNQVMPGAYKTARQILVGAS